MKIMMGYAAILGLIAAFGMSAVAEDVEIGLNARVRAEVKGNADFDGDVEDGSDTIGSRYRLNISAEANDQLKIFFQPQFTKTWGSSVDGAQTSGALNDTGLNVHQAYFTYNFLEQLAFTAGRVELNYGDQLLIGGVGWSNVGRSFDAMKISYNYGMGSVDVLFAEIFEGSASTGTPTKFDTNLTGVYLMNDFGDFAKNVDFYYLIKNDSNTVSNVALNTAYLGARLKSKIGDVDYRTEVTTVAFDEELGREDGQQIDVEVGYSLNAYRFSAEYFSASEDYDQLAPTGHKWLGMADMFSRRNITGFRVGASGKFTDSFSAKVNYHTFSRVESDKTVYSFGGGVYGTGTETTDSAVAAEIDLILDYAFDENFSAQFGIAQVTAGDYIKATKGEDATEFGYLQFVAKF